MQARWTTCARSPLAGKAEPSSSGTASGRWQRRRHDPAPRAWRGAGGHRRDPPRRAESADEPGDRQLTAVRVEDRLSDTLILLAGVGVTVRDGSTSSEVGQPRRRPPETPKSRDKRPRSSVHKPVPKPAYRQDFCDAGLSRTPNSMPAAGSPGATATRCASERRPPPAPPSRTSTRTSRCMVRSPRSGCLWDVPALGTGTVPVVGCQVDCWGSVRCSQRQTTRSADQSSSRRRDVHETELEDVTANDRVGGVAAVTVNRPDPLLRQRMT